MCRRNDRRRQLIDKHDRSAVTAMHSIVLLKVSRRYHLPLVRIDREVSSRQKVCYL